MLNRKREMLLCAALCLPWMLCAEEAASGHYVPGGLSSFVDVLPYDPGFVYVNQFNYYRGDVSGNRRLPLGGNLATGVDAESYASVHVFVYQSDWELLGGRYAAILAIPFARLDIDVSGTLTRPASRRPGLILPDRPASQRSKTISDRCEGLGDIYAAPFALAWKQDDLKYVLQLGVYAPTGEYEKGDLANIGRNYWTFEPTVGMSYLGSKNGIEVTTFAGVDINTENPDTDYRTGEQVHVDLTVAQHLPVGKGFLGLGANAFYYQQITGDSGDGAVLGDFKGRTIGVGPVLSYVAKLGDVDMVLELKWLPELETENRLEGDFVWMKAAFAF